MKKNDWILIFSVILYTFLFYNQFAGVNFLIFNIALVIGLFLKDKSVLQSTNWKISAVFSLLTSLAITIYGNGIAVFANVLALSLLSAYSLKIKNSFLFSVAFSFYSYASSIFYMVLDWQRRNTVETERSLPSVKKTFLIVIPVLISFVFLFIYRASNPLFDDFIEKINLDFISFELIFFTIGGFIILYGFYYHRKINFLSLIDENSKQTISMAERQTTFFGRTLTLNDELYSGKLLFILLNLMILIINVLDFDFLFISHQLPEGITYSQFVHQGAGALIFSILISICIILFYFRGEINFSSQSKFIKALAYLWIIQNVIMLISTALRNGMYIQEYGLTYKRIGVYTYLLLTIIGLITTFIKIRSFKTTSYLIRINSWLFYGVLVLTCFVNWDLMITNYNMKYSGKQSKEYLAGLSETNLPQLYLLEMDRSKSIQPIAIDTVNRASVRYEKLLSSKHFEFNSKDEAMSWRSWNYDHVRVKNELQELNLNSTITLLRLPGRGLYNLNVMKNLWNLTSLDVSSNHIESISAVTIFPGLVELNISRNRLKNISGIENLSKLEYLDLSGNFITDYSPLHSMKNLKKLKLPQGVSPGQLEGIIINLPDVILIKG
jgi:hypothetical protein